MGKSGNPAKAASQTSSVSSFKRRKQGTLLPLPSGETVLAKRTELRTFLLQGHVPNSLMGPIQEMIDKGGEMDASKLVGVGTDDIDFGMIAEMLEMVDNIVVACVVEPKVHAVPEAEDDRDDDLLYVDEVDDEDKMMIFQWALGGTSDLEQFRKEAAADLGSLAEGAGTSQQA